MDKRYTVSYPIDTYRSKQTLFDDKICIYTALGTYSFICNVLLQCILYLLFAGILIEWFFYQLRIVAIVYLTTLEEGLLNKQESFVIVNKDK